MKAEQLKALSEKYQKLTEPGNPLHGFFSHAEVKENYLQGSHPFVIGQRHVEHASKHHGGRLGEETLKQISCAYPGCNLSYGAHKSVIALHLHLSRDLTNKEAAGAMFSVKELMQADGIDGIALPNLDRPYKIAKPEPNAQNKEES